MNHSYKFKQKTEQLMAVKDLKKLKKSWLQQALSLEADQLLSLFRQGKFKYKNLS